MNKKVLLDIDHGTDENMNMNANDRQIGGDHYATKKVQPWEAMESWMSHEQFEGYLRGCALKYIARYPEKGQAEDLMKAAHYLEKLLQHLTK